MDITFASTILQNEEPKILANLGLQRSFTDWLGDLIEDAELTIDTRGAAPAWKAKRGDLSKFDSYDGYDVSLSLVSLEARVGLSVGIYLKTPVGTKPHSYQLLLIPISRNRAEIMTISLGVVFLRRTAAGVARQN